MSHMGPTLFTYSLTGQKTARKEIVQQKIPRWQFQSSIYEWRDPWLCFGRVVFQTMTCFQRCQEQEKYIWIYWSKGTFLFMRWWAFLLETTIAIILMRLEFLKLNVLNERHGLWSLLNHLRTDDVILKLFCTFWNLCLIDLLFSACTNLGGWQTFFPRTVWGGLKSRSVFSLACPNNSEKDWMVQKGLFLTLPWFSDCISCFPWWLLGKGG